MSMRTSRSSGTVPGKRACPPDRPAPPQASPKTPRKIRKKNKGSAVGTAIEEVAAGDVPEAVRYSMIAQAAYYRAEKRGFGPGQQLDDWLAAEAEITAGWLQKIPAAGDESCG